MPSIGTAIQAAARKWAELGRLRLVNVIRDRKLAGQVLRRRTGTAARSVTGELLATNDGFSVGTALGYLIAWERGIQAHTVRAKHAKALRFVSNGEVIFRRKVFIPAQAARPSFEPAFDEAQGYLETTATALISQAIKVSVPDRTIPI